MIPDYNQESLIIKQSHINYYKENGYLIINKVVSNNILDNYLDNIRLVANRDFAAIMNPDRFEFLVAQSCDLIKQNWSLRKKVEFLNHCKKVNKIIFELMKNDNIVKILQMLQNKTVVGLMSQMLFKEANSTYCSQAWAPHQDNAYPKNDNGAYITTNLFFADSNMDNGTIYVFPKSHKDGLFECEMRPSYREKKGSSPGNTIKEKDLVNFEKVNLDFKKGDLLVLHGNLVHGSYPNFSKNSRPLLSCSYINEGENFISGNNAQRKVINLK